MNFNGYKPRAIISSSGVKYEEVTNEFVESFYPKTIEISVDKLVLKPDGKDEVQVTLQALSPYWTDGTRTPVYEPTKVLLVIYQNQKDQIKQELEVTGTYQFTLSNYFKQDIKIYTENLPSNEVTIKYE